MSTLYQSWMREKRRPVATGEVGSRTASGVTPARYVPDAIVSEHAGMGGEGYQVGVIAVKVDLNQVAALPVEDPYGKQSAVTALLQHSYFGGIRARQVDPGNEGAALGERPSCARIFGKRVDDILGRSDHAQSRTRVERTHDATDGADTCLVVGRHGYGPARGAEGIAQFASEQFESGQRGRGPHLVEQADETGNQVVRHSPARQGRPTPPLDARRQGAVTGCTQPQTSGTEPLGLEQGGVGRGDQLMACARRGIAGGRAPADRNIVTELASNLAAGGVGETLRLGERGGGQHDAELVPTQACDQRRPEGRGHVT